MSEEKEVIFMQANNRKASANNVKLFGSTKVLVISALLIAMSIVLGKLLAFNIGSSIRISFENLPIVMSGIFFGPFIGAAVGLCADLIGCIVTGQAPLPFITVGVVAVGFVSGLVYQLLPKAKLIPRVALSAGLAHLTGNVIIKTIALYYAFPEMRSTLIFRPVNYAIIASIECILICLLLSHKAIAEEVRKLRK